MITVGIKIVWGLPTQQKPIAGVPCDAIRMRFRFRAGNPARAWVRTSTGISEYMLRDDGQYWSLLPLAENRTVRPLITSH
jgi:hypothetical protein